jgi:hydrogenase maturation protease
VYHKAEGAQKPANATRVAILGVGNILLKDEGVGIHVIHALQDNPLLTDAGVELIDGGTSPNVSYLLDGADRLIVIDAVEGGCEPGTIYRFRAKNHGLYLVETKNEQSWRPESVAYPYDKYYFLIK